MRHVMQLGCSCCCISSQLTLHAVLLAAAAAPPPRARACCWAWLRAAHTLRSASVWRSWGCRCARIAWWPLCRHSHRRWQHDAVKLPNNSTWVRRMWSPWVMCRPARLLFCFAGVAAGLCSVSAAGCQVLRGGQRLRRRSGVAPLLTPLLGTRLLSALPRSQLCHVHIGHQRECLHFHLMLCMLLAGTSC